MAYVVIRSDGVMTNSFSYRGGDAVEVFLTEMEQEEERIRDDLEQPAAMSLSREEEQQFQDATTCWICDKPLLDRVRDHDHVSGDFRGAAHQV